MISEHHPLALKYFWSYPAMVAERRRHLCENRNIIHPFSTFNLFWRSFMIVITLTHLVTSSLRLCVIIEPHEKLHLDYIDSIIAFAQLFCFIDMIFNFNTGYIDIKSNLIVLSRRRIARSYIHSFWLVDLVSCVPIAFLMLLARQSKRENFLIPKTLPLLRAARIITIYKDFRTLFRTLTTSYIWYRIVRHIIMFILAVHFFTCLLYWPSSMQYYLHGSVQHGYNGFLDLEIKDRVITDVSDYDRYVKGMFVAVSAFFSTGFNMFTTYFMSEILINSSILLIATMFKMYTIVFALKTYMTLYNSSAQYYELMDQVEKYMHYQQFPAPLMKRLREFYNYRFQGYYYKNDVAFGCLSEQLQNEIRLHTCLILVDKVPVLRDLPSATLGKVLGWLEPEVYMPNDLIFHVGDIGTHMYFILTGTVVFYSVKGVEVYHFEDGDFFGEMAYLLPGHRRQATFVAIEITQVYALSYEHLRDIIKQNPAMFEHIKEESYKRMSMISLIDPMQKQAPYK